MFDTGIEERNRTRSFLTKSAVAIAFAAIPFFTVTAQASASPTSTPAVGAVDCQQWWQPCGQQGGWEQGQQSPWQQGPWQQGPWQQGPWQQGPGQQGPWQQGPWQQGPWQQGPGQQGQGQGLGSIPGLGSGSSL